MADQDVVGWKARLACGSFQSGWTPPTFPLHLCSCERGRRGGRGKREKMDGLKRREEEDKKNMYRWYHSTVSKHIMHLLRLCAVSSGVSQTIVVYTRPITITASAVSVWASLSGGEVCWGGTLQCVLTGFMWLTRRRCLYRHHRTWVN